MINLVKILLQILATNGIKFKRIIVSIRRLPQFYKDYNLLREQKSNSNEEFEFGNWYPCLHDRFESSGSASGHYFHQDLLVAKKIFRNSPSVHVDVGSRIDGFVAHVATYRIIEVLDIRLLPNKIENIVFKQADLMGELRGEFEEYCDSLSCLHALEHFGLGRYGDSVDYDGYLKGLDNIYKILKKSGKLYFSVPIGPQRIEFNAHRVFSVGYLIKLFEEKYNIDSFSYVDGKGDLHEDVHLESSEIESNFGCSYGCGIFELTKI